MHKYCFALCAAALVVCAQQPAAAPATPPAPAFEVASIKPARGLQEQALSGKMHVGMKVDGAMVDIGSMSISDLIQTAYKVKIYQVSGPDWMKSERFDILAKLPEGANKDQVPEMLQTLLADRFKLTFHRDNRQQSIYALVVAKGGPKMKEAPPDPATPPDQPAKEDKGAMVVDTGQGKVSVKQDGRGGVSASGPNGTSHITMENGAIHMEMDKVSMTALVEALTRFVDRPVVDMTELKGEYQVSIEIGMDEIMRAARSAGVNVSMPAGRGGAADSAAPGDAASDPSAGSLFSSLERMGLKLESRKAPAEIIVVDHVEKAPTEN